MPLPTLITSGIRPSAGSPRQIADEFRRLLRNGVTLRPAGDAKQDPGSLLRRGYTPRYKIELFHTTYYLTNPRVDESIGFFVGYVLDQRAQPRVAYPRIFYKDVSLVWRVGTHLIETEYETWIGKGDVKITRIKGEETVETAEETTDLPLEVQPAFDEVMRRAGRSRRDELAVGLILRRAPRYRVEPYRDFTDPRDTAHSRNGGSINAGKPIARFTRRNDPTSLKFVRGFEPDFRSRGIVEITRTVSRFYGGPVRKVRVLSRNGQIQYAFMVTPRLIWIVPPQATTTEIMSYGVRTVDVHAPDELFVPGYEYHYIDDDVRPPSLHTQIPPGFAGEPHPRDPYRADASKWLEALPVVKRFRRVLPRMREGR